MAQKTYEFTIKAENHAIAGSSAAALADALGQVDGVLEAIRGKVDEDTMDLGVVISVLATSGATLAIARGLAAWLRARRGVTVAIEMDGKSGSLKAAVQGIDPEAAIRIVEIIREA